MNCKSLQKHSGITKQWEWFSNDYLQVMPTQETLRTGTDNSDLLILNKRSFLLYGHFSFVQFVDYRYKFYCTTIYSLHSKLALLVGV
jgi:hypothetical protein